jgi:hypothetical protein
MKKYSWDELQRLHANDLKRLCIDVRSKINKRKRLKEDATELEVDFCYIVRALEKCGNVQKT